MWIDVSDRQYEKHDLQIISTDRGIINVSRLLNENAESSINCNSDPFSNQIDSSD
jgi:hypothetical protein